MIKSHQMSIIVGDHMKLLRSAVAAAVGTAAMLATSMQPALAAYPVTDFPNFGLSQFGANQTSVTWYNRSVGISGTVIDYNGNDGQSQRVCVAAYTRANATGVSFPNPDGGWNSLTCRYASGGSVNFNFTIDGAPAGGFQSVRVWSFTIDYVTGPWGEDNRTRNRPAA
jgi:hypothetical protein